jgi:predicted nucleotidyltransferase
MNEVIDIDKMKERLVEQLKPINALKIILFGSYAYGTPDKDSDIDICIIKNNIGSRIEEKRKIRKLLNNLYIAKDIIVSTQREFDFYKNEFGSVYMDIDKKGTVLWTAI